MSNRAKIDDLENRIEELRNTNRLLAVQADRMADELTTLKVQPEPDKVIDLSKIVGSDVPMWFWTTNPGSKLKSYLDAIKPHDSHPWRVNSGKTVKFPDRVVVTTTGYFNIEFDPHHWVANVSGENPWPEGVIVQVKYRKLVAQRPSDYARMYDWELMTGDVFEDSEVIASRFVRIADGWVMP